jgi:outer membrane protein assembly factor BamB
MPAPRLSRRLAAGLLLWACCGLLRAENWPQWRGPRNDGVSSETGLPATWSRSENVCWRLPLPGPAGATPVVWNDRIFLTSSDHEDLVLICANTQGERLWKRKVSSGDRHVRGDEGNSASPSPVTDGKHVWTFMANGALACYDVDSQEAWHFNLQDRYGPFDIAFGLTSTPVLDGDRLYFQLIHSGGALVLALDKSTGKEIWKQRRPSDATAECLHSYASPMLYRSGKDEFLLTHGADYIVAHRLSDGEEIFRCGGMNPKGTYNQTLRFVASPVAVPGLIVVPSAKNGPVLALNPRAKGDITESDQGHLWTRPDNTPDVPSPLVHDGLVYLCRENGVLICLDAKTGKEIYQKRMHSHRHRASPVYADGKVYCTARDGVVTVVKAGRKFEVLASNDLDEGISASPAISGGRIYLRTFDALYAIGNPSATAMAAPANAEKPAAAAIFNGRDLSGWIVEGTKTVQAGKKEAPSSKIGEPVWSVADGRIVCAGSGYGFLRYEKQLADFEFSVDFLMAKRCNTGIGIRGVVFTGPAETRPSFAGYEIQLLDDAGQKPTDHSTGSLYRYLAAKSNPIKPAGEWNTIVIRCTGPRIQVSINGAEVQDVDQRTVPAIKDKPLQGYVSLQNHGGRAEFRNLLLRELKPADAESSISAR